MNDQLEIEHWPEEGMKHIYFISFMKEQEESIGMWAMYAQPWEIGVKVSIKKSAVRNWIKSIDRIYCVDPKTNTVDTDEFGIYIVTEQMLSKDSVKTLGDINDDEEIDIADALLIARYDAGLIELEEAQLDCADVNKDEETDIADALLIARYDAGLIDSLGN